MSTDDPRLQGSRIQSALSGCSAREEQRINIVQPAAGVDKDRAKN